MLTYKLQTVLRFVSRYNWLIALIIIAILLMRLKDQNEKVEDYREVNKLQESEIIKWKDQSGKNRAMAQIAEVNAKNIKRVLQEDLKKFLKKEVGNIKKNLISYSSVKSSTSGRVTFPLKDSLIDNGERLIEVKSINYKSKYLQLSGMYLPNTDSLILVYKVSHNFDYTYYYKKRGKPPFNVFNRKEAVAQIRFHNPGTEADSIYTIVLKRKKGLLGRLLSSD